MNAATRATARAALVAVATTVCGCATPTPSPATHDTVSAAMNRWKGHLAREAVGMWGMPDAMGREGTLMMLSWRTEDSGGAPSSADDRNQAWPNRCARVLGVDAAEIIRTVRWYGNHCSTQAEDYATPDG